MTQPPIADYAIIGDARSAALISRDGSIDWSMPVRPREWAVTILVVSRTVAGEAPEQDRR